MHKNILLHTIHAIETNRHLEIAKKKNKIKYKIKKKDCEEQLGHPYLYCTLGTVACLS